MKLEDLDRISKIKGKPQNNNYKDWRWPSFFKTLLAQHYLNQNKDFYQSPHEGLLLTKNCCKKIVDFLESNDEIKKNLFNLLKLRILINIVYHTYFIKIIMVFRISCIKFIFHVIQNS